MPFYHSEHRQINLLRFLHHQPLVQINPTTARELGIREGDWVWIETLRGRIKQVATLTEAVHPRTVCTERGWWFPERKGEEPDLYDIWQSNSNVLTSGAPEFCDPKSGSWANRGLLCRVYKVEGEDKP
jgi:anaerobic selenocysteine-containing dehydrogenase